jgi:hypothetical protein
MLFLWAAADSETDRAIESWAAMKASILFAAEFVATIAA